MPAMALPAGTKIGVYEIVAAIGAGGMGEVYRAHDTKLRRDVAIKVLAPFMANDPDHLARFGREARLLAALNHPRIATIHGFDETDGIHALAMELVEGPTLAEKLRGSRSLPKTGLPLPETLKIGGQIAEAIEAAHAKGVVHRDLKPANIKLGLDGNVKVLDFGVAKAFSSEPAGDEGRPTITVTGFQAGRIIGTPAYMSPEQARGQTVDKQTDIWAFGCVLYEMLTGRLAFPGETISDSIAAVLERQPDWDAVPVQTPASIRRLVRRCLDKDPSRRLHDIADARIEIDDVRTGSVDAERLSPNAAPAGLRPAWVLALVPIVLIAAVAGVWWLRSRSSVADEVRLEINTPPTEDPSLAISPDGRTVVFVGKSDGHAQLWLRPLDSSAARPLGGTERASLPFWSPDGRSIGFFADVGLKRMDIDGGSVKTLSSDVAVALGATWNQDGTILFANNPAGPILRTSVDGAEPATATRIGLPQQRGHMAPRFLPDGRHFLFFASGTPDSRGVHVGQLDALDSKRLFDADTPAVYTAGHLLFVREGRLLAQAFDPDRLQVTGSPFSIAEHVTSRTAVSASAAAAGRVVYRTSPSELAQRQLVWVDRAGRETNKVVYPDSAALSPALSPDGRRILIGRFAKENMDLWSYEARRDAWDRVTFDPGDDIFPLWSPDGASIVFGAVRGSGAKGIVSLYQMADGGAPGSETVLLSTQDHSFPMDWSVDGRFLLFDSLNPKRGFDIWAMPLDGDRKPFAVVQTEFSEGLPQFSPDGKWIAYQSDRSGRSEVYLRPFRGPGADSRVSTDGGAQVRWNRSGKELFYIGSDGQLTAVPVRFSPDGKTVDFGAAQGLFVTDVGNAPTPIYRQQYVVSADGQSFVMNSVVGGGVASPIAVILNWKPRP